MSAPPRDELKAVLDEAEDEVEALLEGLNEAQVAEARLAAEAPPKSASNPMGPPSSEASRPAVKAEAATGAKAPLSATSKDAPKRSGAAKWLVGGALLAVVAGAGVVTARRGSAVKGLQPGEHLYVDGQRVDAPRLEAEQGARLFVSTARDGRLSRFGNLSVEGAVDVRAVPEAQVQPGQTGALEVSSAPEGCELTLDGRTATGVTTPARVVIEAARELELTVRCGQRQWSTWVMAVPNQEISIQATLD